MIPTHALGSSGLAVSALGFGAWAIGGNRYGNSYGATDDAESTAAVRRALDLGCTLFDTADVYGHGHSETLLGRALGPDRPRVVVATKVGANFYHRGVSPKQRQRLEALVAGGLGSLAPDVVLPIVHTLDFSPEYLRFACERSLQRLSTDYVDLLQLHNPSAQTLADPGTYDVLDRLREEGKIRTYGVSVHTVDEALGALQTGRPATVQIVHNFVRREVTPALAEAAARSGAAVIAREPLANGLLTGRYDEHHRWEEGDIRARMPEPYVAQVVGLARQLAELGRRDGLTAPQMALSFTLAQPGIDCVVAGMKTPSQVDENFGVFR